MVSAQVLQTKGCATPSSAPNEIKSTSIGLGSIDEWQTGSVIGSSNANHQVNSNIDEEQEQDDNDAISQTYGYTNQIMNVWAVEVQQQE